MTAPVHLEGLGWLGSVVADALTAEGIDFTWHDARRKVAAWPASTGLVFPSYEPAAVASYETFRDWVTSGVLGANVARTTFWYTALTPPGATRAPKGTKIPRPAADLGWLRAAPLPAWQVNVQRVVWDAQTRYESTRLDGPRRDAPVYVCSHGFTRGMIDAYSWGWSAKVRVEWPTDVWDRSVHGPPTLYAKTGAWVANYLYPIAGEPEVFWAGSAQIHQRSPSRLDTHRHWTGWNERVARLTGGRLNIEQVGEIRQGWRPKPARPNPPPVLPNGRPDQGMPITPYPTVGRHPDLRREAIMMPPMASSGVRLAPLAVGAVVELVRARCGQRVARS